MSVQKAVKSSHYEAESNMEQDVITSQLLLVFSLKLFYICWVFYCN